MVWSCSANGRKSPTEAAVQMEANLREAQTRETQDSMEGCYQEDIDLLGLGLTVEDAEQLAQDRTVWRTLSSQAAGAEMHEADR